ncbi:unnamed protein product [Rotaria magnacalcarata]|uniref:GH18 domain-containing protein n=2 Tax=Rotaria magnacalcarata TaxID=392030 RepID=A0A816WZJ9_9BILA|nr:unnamed protein product [Rotaria magnacalcarata]
MSCTTFIISMCFSLIYLSLLLLLVNSNLAVKYSRVCYFTNWGVHRSMKEARLRPEDIPADLCTHIFYAFAGIGGLTLQAKHPNDLNIYQGEQPLYPRIMKLKEKNPDLKILISCGGWGNSGEFDSIASSESSRETFSKNAITFCRQHGFDGVDLDWEFPSSNHRENFGLLTRTMHRAFKKEAKKAKKDRLLISLAVAAGEVLVKQGYDVPVLCHYVDLINVMTYDLYGSWTNKIGHHSALFHRRGEKGLERDLNTNSSMYNWVKAGGPRDRLIIGIPGYGRAFIASGGDPLKAYGEPGGVSSISSPYLGESGLLAFYEICKKELSEGFKRYWHKEHEISISFKDGTWIGYDDPESVRNKCEYVKREGFGGAMIWALDMDDFSGKFCQKNRKKRLKRFPLVNAMKQVFEYDEITTQITTLPIQTTTFSNGSILLDEEIQTLLDQMFEEASSSSLSSSLSQFYSFLLIIFIILTT